MSPRAAWRLETAGFTRVYDYVAGKSDWLAADLPFEGEARLAGQFTRRNTPTVTGDDSVATALSRLDETGFGPVIALNGAGVVMGSLHRDDMDRADPGARARDVLRFGVSTVRPAEEVHPLVQRMQHTNISRIIVTRSDGPLVGLFFSADSAATNQ